MKIKTSAIALCFVSVIVIVLGLVFYNYGLPFLNFMNNQVPEESGSAEKPSIDSILMGTPEPGTTGNPNDHPLTTSQSEYAPEIPESAINILLLGIDESAELTDTIVVLSVDQDAKQAKIISIPRDSYVPYSNDVRQALRNEGLYYSPGMFKINAAKNIGSNVINYQGGKFENKGINFLCSVINNLLGYRIDDYVYVNFEGFKDVVDAFGGVTITVEEDMRQSDGTLVLPKGVHKLDGNLALFYARARHRYDADGNELGSLGDSYRKSHQLKMLTEMASQVVTVDNVLNAGNILNSLRNAVYHSFDLNNLSGYISLGMDYANGKYEVETILIQGDEIDPLGDGVSYVKIYS